MGKKGGQAAPAQPDPVATAQAQTGMNVNTAQANTYLQNANEVGPTGSVNYSYGQNVHTITDPNTGRQYTVDTPTRTTTLSPEQQKIFDTNQAMQQSLSSTGLSQSQKIGDILGTPISFGGAYQATPGQLQTQLGPSDYEASRKSVEQAMMARAAPQLNAAKQNLEANLEAQGFKRGTEAFNQQMGEWGQQYNDMTTQAILAGGQEQSRLFGMDLSRMGAQNQAVQQQYALDSAKRGTDIQESLLLRQTPINEINALLSSSQIQMPQFSAYNPGSVANTPYGDYVYKGADIASQNWRQQQASDAASEGAMWGALGSLGGGLLSRSERRKKRDLLLESRDADGLGWWHFNYIWDPPDAPRRFGVMLDEVERLRPAAAVWIGDRGYVDYARL